MKKFTVITKGGSKWLRPVLNPSDTDQLSRFFQNAGDGFEDLPYIGSHPEGTAVDESEVREVTQTRHKDEDPDYWYTSPSQEHTDFAGARAEYRIRIAYTDTESHDRHISEDYPGIEYQPLFDHMSKVHGLTLTTGEMDEIIGLSAYILAKK